MYKYFILYTIFFIIFTEISDKNMPTPPPPGPSRDLPAKCPGRFFCRKRHRTLNAWKGYPGFYVVCPSSGNPTCMACPADTIFNEYCQTCVHKNQQPSKGCKWCFFCFVFKLLTKPQIFLTTWPAQHQVALRSSSTLRS